ncbi:unnamed protein product [Spirodela intermedia]|uniref:CDC20/Fizzy WD40 domain-containing protein n=1 Tax=Spirodela intermedia TaxID=51605 RepID=A0A7I8JIP2_SPIIN|nr:unnamed protein product [Spirodela intermedia]CAA6670016.1 unnamed protein product [Spirodela intermedia]
MASWGLKSCSEDESSSISRSSIQKARQARLISRQHGVSKHSGDRFIPNRSAMDFDMAFYLLTQTRKEKEKAAALASHPGQTYGKLLAERLLPNRNRILAFQARPPASSSTAEEVSFDHQPKSDAVNPGMADDYYLNVLDWGSRNILSIALGSTVHLWNGTDGSTWELMRAEDDLGAAASVSWAPDGRYLALGLNGSDVQLWDADSSDWCTPFSSRIALMEQSHSDDGREDGKVVNNDVRIRSHVVHSYRGHRGEVCGLRWSGSGRLHIWDLRRASTATAPRTSQGPWIHRFDKHASAVKALAWCPFQSNLLASGGGGNDRCIKLWNTENGTCLDSVDTGREELLSSHGFGQNQLTLWKYPSFRKIIDLTGHSSRVLCTAVSPDGCTVASVSGDETLRFWNVFGSPETTKRSPPKPPPDLEPFSSFSRIR